MKKKTSQADRSQIQKDTCQSSIVEGYLIKEYLCYRIVRGNVKHVSLAFGDDVDAKGDQAEKS